MRQISDPTDSAKTYNIAYHIFMTIDIESIKKQFKAPTEVFLTDYQ